MNRRARLRAFKCRQGLHRWYLPWAPWEGAYRGVLVCADCHRTTSLTQRMRQSWNDESPMRAVDSLIFRRHA